MKFNNLDKVVIKPFKEKLKEEKIAYTCWPTEHNKASIITEGYHDKRVVEIWKDIVNT